MSRSEQEIYEWVSESLHRELGFQKEVADLNSFGSGTYVGAIEILAALRIFLADLEEE